ncbi:MAG: hypothetical protein ACKVQR_16660 [Aquabacterium sp.]
MTVPRPSLRRRAAGWLAALALSACGGGGDSGAADSRTADVSQSADVAVLMMGNSHTGGAGLPARLQAALQAALPGRSVFVYAVPRLAFLDEHLEDPATLALLGARRWQAVVLQAQKYSSSGMVDYPTAAAEELVRRVRNSGAVPLLYPEWARYGVDEADRIWALHAGIAAREPACVAPIPQAWSHALVADPALRLHASDGNHAAEAGAQLTSLVLMATITGISPASVGDVAGGGEAGLQAMLRGAAAAALAAHGARSLCPGQPLIR